MIIGIVAISRNYAIGKDGKLPWHYPADLKFFKETTTDHAIVMGSNTWRSIGRPLPRRLNIVLSRNAEIDLPSGVVLLRDTREVNELSVYLKCNIYVIGGAKTYEGFADLIDRWVVTEIPETIDDADVFMPRTFTSGFTCEQETHLAGGLIIKHFSR